MGRLAKHHEAIKAIKHYVFVDGDLREFSNEESLLIANGVQTVPEFSGQQLRYLQVQVLEPEVGDSKDTVQVEVRVAGASLVFDQEGGLSEANALDESQEMTEFERQTCAELALQSADLMVSPLQ